MLNTLKSMLGDKTQLPRADQALPGHDEPMPISNVHFVNGNPLRGPFPDPMETAIFALGCFWGAERCFWETPGVYSTSVGYTGGITPNPSYAEVCTGMTGHTEAVQIVYNPAQVSYADLLKQFWESHDPTQGMRQGNDRGSQYRSGIYTLNRDQETAAKASMARYAEELKAAGYSAITTEIKPVAAYYFAEEDHQQYLAKNIHGYCGLGGTGVHCPAPVSNG